MFYNWLLSVLTTSGGVVFRLSGSYRVCVRMCLVIMSRLHAAYGHCGHLYGFSPVWVRWWVLRWSDLENTWPHTRHV